MDRIREDVRCLTSVGRSPIIFKFCDWEHIVDETILALLNNIVNFMEKNGTIRHALFFDIDEKLVNEIYDFTGKQYSLQELKIAADKCFAHEWIEHRSLGAQYGSLGITEKGLGVVRSKRKQESDKRGRSALKKISDYIEDHKGLFVFLGLVIALVTVAQKLIAGK